MAAVNEIVIADPSALAVHPAAALFPMLDERELAELASDIQTNGLVSPIVVKDGEILDGRNRLSACNLAGAAPRFVEWTGAGSITSWIFSVNLHRRHLTTSQRAMLAARAVDVFAHEAAQRMASGVHVEEEEKGKAREKVAEQLHVGDQSVLRAQQVLRHAAPELVAAVDAGEVAVAAAAEVAMLPPEAQRELVREKRVPERAREVREQRRPSPPPPPPLPPPPTPATTTPPTPQGAAMPTPDVPDVGDDGGESAEEREESTLDPRNRPDPQPVQIAAFRSDYRKGTSPADEAIHVEQILAAARTALQAWRWIVIEWNEDRRWDMKFAIHESGQIAMHMNQAVAKLEEVAAICSGRKPAPPPEGP